MSVPIPVPAMQQPARTVAGHYLALRDGTPGAPPPGLVVVMPTAWANKYQLMLYSGAAERNYAVLGARTPSDLETIWWPEGPVILHAHWFASIFQGALTQIEARQRLARAQAEIEAFQARTGARLIWTAHNVVPHGNAFPEVFLDLRRWIFEKFDAVHVMQEAHLPILEAAFERPAPATFTLPHPHYRGMLLDNVSGPVARVHLGLGRGEFVFSFFGSIQSYKNAGQFLEAFERVRAARPGRRLRAVVGGLPVDSAEARRIDQRWGAEGDILLRLESIPDHEIQYLHRAADVMVLPYAETLNSGAAMMAASFGKPFLMPAGPASDGLEGLGVCRYDGADPQGLEQAMAACLDRLPEPADPARLAMLEPARVSAMFFDEIDRLCR